MEPPPIRPSDPLPVKVMVAALLLVVTVPALFSDAPLRVNVMFRLEPNVTPEFTVIPPLIVVEYAPPKWLITLLVPAYVRNWLVGMVAVKLPPFVVNVAVAFDGPVTVIELVLPGAKLIVVAPLAVTKLPLPKLID